MQRKKLQFKIIGIKKIKINFRIKQFFSKGNFIIRIKDEEKKVDEKKIKISSFLVNKIMFNIRGKNNVIVKDFKIKINLFKKLAIETYGISNEKILFDLHNFIKITKIFIKLFEEKNEIISSYVSDEEAIQLLKINQSFMENIVQYRHLPMDKLIDNKKYFKIKRR